VGHLARKAATATLIFTFSEALIGAALVLFELVAHDRSAARAFSISLHLLNTLILLASITLCIRSSKVSERRLSIPRELVPWFFASYISFAGLAVTGALNALGDTLFKSTSLAAGMAQDFAPGSHFLVKLRIAHPSLAIGTATLLFLFAEQCESLSPDTRRWAKLTQAGVFLQLALGALNLAMLAPNSMQLVHLLVADLVWVSLVMLGVSALETRSVEIFTGFGEPSIGSQALS
jgi:heme A synthase